MPYQTDFDLDIPSAIHDQLVSVFEDLDTADLFAIAPTSGVDVTDRPGVYGLYRGGELVYVGKATSLHRRLNKHRVKLSGRLNLNDVRFKAVAVHRNWNAYAPESILLAHYERTGLCDWNGSGFGPNDPGRNREQTNMPPEGFHAKHPIRADWACDWVEAGDHDVLELLVSLKRGLPFLLRYESPGHYTRGHTDFQNKTVVLAASGLPATELLKSIVEILPGWQATMFPSHMILYRESRDYKFGTLIGRGNADGA